MEEKDSCPVVAAAHHLPAMTRASSSTPDAHTVLPSLTYQCPVCFLTYFTIIDLKNHFTQVHPDTKSINCIQCNAQVPGSSAARPAPAFTLVG